jgi:hypothetical protein
LNLDPVGGSISPERGVNITGISKNMADIMPIVEYAFAKRLKPLVGKHK